MQLMLTLHYLVGAQTDAKALCKISILNNHTILNQTENVAQLKYVLFFFPHPIPELAEDRIWGYVR